MQASSAHQRLLVTSHQFGKAMTAAALNYKPAPKPTADTATTPDETPVDQVSAKFLGPTDLLVKRFRPGARQPETGG
jgi:hypothetical protein